jgi:hypothetical protein
MKNILRAMSVLSTVTLGLVVACGGANEGTVNGPPSPPPPERGVTSAQTHSDATTVDRLVRARCNREQACNNVGTGQKFASRDACVADIRASTAADLNATDCPRGLDQGNVDRCLAAIENEKCDHPLDTITRVGDCQSYHLCMK